MNRKIVCYGAGVIGASWATCFTLHGQDVTLYDVNAQYLSNAKKRVSDNLRVLYENGYLSCMELQNAEKRLSYTTDPKSALLDADFIQESVPELLELKQNVVQIIDKYMPDHCITASSTSGLRISDIVAKSSRRKQYIGAHPFNPPHLIPLVEITKGEYTDSDTLENAISFYRSVGKEPIVLNKEKKGFVANRLQHAVLREVIALVTEGVCSVADADRALTYGPGLRWAAIGQGMIGELASPEGAEVFNRNFRTASEGIFSDLSDIKTIPESWFDLIGPGVKDELEQLNDTIGHSREEVALFRDTVLLELLRIHKKI